MNANDAIKRLYEVIKTDIQYEEENVNQEKLSHEISQIENDINDACNKKLGFINKGVDYSPILGKKIAEYFLKQGFNAEYSTSSKTLGVRWKGQLDIDHIVKEGKSTFSVWESELRLKKIIS